MKLELDKYGIQMPAFSKIGGILANELSVDEAAGKTHAFPLIITSTKHPSNNYMHYNTLKITREIKYKSYACRSVLFEFD